MKYTIKTVKYLMKNLIYVLPLVIIPAIFLSFTVARGDIVAVSEKMIAKNYSAITFTEIFQAVSLFNFSSWGTAIAGFFGLATLIVCVSLLMAFTDKHMRFGKRTFNGLFGKLNDNLLSTFAMTALLVSVYELWTLILSALLMLCLQAEGALGLVLGGCVFVGMHFVLTYVITLVYLWLPCMQITGFRTFEALRYGFLLCEPIQGKLTLVQSVSMLFAEFAIAATTLWLPEVQAVSILVTAGLYAAMILSFCVRMQIVYFDRGQIERADLKAYYDV
jgi:hypothetical protein